MALPDNETIAKNNKIILAKNKIKILVVNKQDPGKTTYISREHVGTFMCGRRLSNYIVMAVGEDLTEVIDLPDGDFRKIQKQVANKLEGLAQSGLEDGRGREVE